MQPKTKSGYLTNPHSLSHVYLLVRLNQHSLTPSLRNTEIPIIPRGCYIRSSWLLFLSRLEMKTKRDKPRDGRIYLIFTFQERFLGSTSVH